MNVFFVQILFLLSAFIVGPTPAGGTSYTGSGWYIVSIFAMFIANTFFEGIIAGLYSYLPEITASDSERGLLGGVGLSWTNFGVLINCILALVLLISGKRKAELGETTVTETRVG